MSTASDDKFEDEDHPLWLVNEQIKGLLEGDGASEDHEAVLKFLRDTGLPPGTVRRVHLAIVGAEVEQPVPCSWISCETCLPNHGVEVLVWRQGVIGSRFDIGRCYMTSCGPVWNVDRHSWTLPAFLVRKVTHWMAVPPLKPQQG